MKLNLGCGQDYKKGYINCDSSKTIKVDKILDLEKPLNFFKNNSVDEILCFHVLEHINNLILLIHELHRISKNSALIHIKVPFYSSWGQFNDPTHVRFFTPWTFVYFNGGKFGHEVKTHNKMFEFKKIKINFGVGNSSKLNFIFNPLINFNHKIYCRFFAWIFPAAEIEFKLKVLKDK